MFNIWCSSNYGIRKTCSFNKINMVKKHNKTLSKEEVEEIFRKDLEIIKRRTYNDIMADSVDETLRNAHELLRKYNIKLPENNENAQEVIESLDYMELDGYTNEKYSIDVEFGGQLKFTSKPGDFDFDPN